MLSLFVTLRNRFDRSKQTVHTEYRLVLNAIELCKIDLL